MTKHKNKSRSDVPNSNVILSGVPGLNNWANIASTRYNGPLPDFTGQLRCWTGVQDLGKDRIILIRPDQLEAKKQKYPQLLVMETVQ
ncbi:hypothetical protein [Spirosoma aerolatum]|uniref:hypothetical protein n=1 Tax=Spirosoma aerolatum TaxID=1211326 RepID=UPI0012D366D4|nr:hypothetical protein [Spirosoma aerolatum]